MKMKRNVIVIVLMLCVMLFSAAKRWDNKFRSTLSDRYGLPLDDGTYKVTFNFYDNAKKGIRLASETKLVKCKDGITNTELASLKDLANKGYKEVWISVKTDELPETEYRVKRYIEDK